MPEGSSLPNPDKNAPSHGKGFTRRRLLKGAVVAMGLKAVENVAGAGIVSRLIGVNDLREVNEKKSYSTGPLAGRVFKANDLFSLFTGIQGKALATVEVNFHDQLKILFQKKREFVERQIEKRAKDPKNKKRTPNTLFKQFEDIPIKEYAEKGPERMDLRTYQKGIELAMAQVRKDIDWNKVKDLMNLNSDELKTLSEITSALLPEHLTAYALTELMPSSDGDLNRDVLEFLLKNAGSRYVYSLPSIYDDRVSFGPYQISAEALGYIDLQHPVGGVSKINGALPESKRLPNSIANLRGADHHKAALLFAIYNLATLIKKLQPKELVTLKKVWKNHITAVVQYIAAAHHMPKAAYRSARYWLDAEAKRPFEISCLDSIRHYAISTKANLF